MSLRQKALPTPSAVATGQTATFDLDLGKRYHSLWLEVGDDASVSADGTLEAALARLITQIRLKVNGKVQRTMTAIELNRINGLMGAAFDATSSGTIDTAAYRIYLPIWFSEPWRKNNTEVPLTAWNAAGIDSFQLEVDMGATVNAPVLTGFYEYDAPVGGMGAIVKWIRQTFGASGTVQDFNTISKRDWLQSIHLFPPTGGYANKVKFTANGEDIRDLLTSLQNQQILAGRELVPETIATAYTSNLPRFDLVFDYDDPVNGALNANGLNEMTLHVEYSATVSGSMVSIIQRTGPPE